MLLCLVCLTLLASFIHLSFKNMYIHVHVLYTCIYTCINVLIVPQNDLNSVKWLAVFCDEVQVIKVIDYVVYIYMYCTCVPYHIKVYVYMYMYIVYTCVYRSRIVVYWPLLICLRGCTLKSPLP